MMTVTNKELFLRRVNRLAKTKGTLYTNVSVYRHSGKKPHLRGYMIETSALFPMAFEPVGKHEPQYMGVHECMILTIRRPKHVVDMLDIAKDLPRVEPFGDIIWLGSVLAVQTRPSKRALRFSIPHRVWQPRAPIDGICRCQAVIRPYPSPRSRFIYYVMEVLAIQRKHVVPEFLMPGYV
jgi:hypothetical protein